MTTLDSSQWMYSSASEFYSHTIDQSLRFEDGDSASMSRTNSSAGNRRTWTFSAWVKRSNLGSGTQNYILGATTDNYNVNWAIFFFGSDELTFYSYTSSQQYQINTGDNGVFRDPSAWYNLVLAWDTTQSTAADRIKLYVNGSQFTNFETAVYPSLNYEEGYINNNIQQDIGRAATAAYGYDGYMAEVNFIDGQALSPTSFGETKAGIWIPKDTSGLTFGTNGFRLKFQDSSALGDDTSGNNNDFTPTGLAATDVLIDSPSNNWATMNPLNGDGGTTWKEGNLELSTTNYGNNASTFFMESGKWYWEAIGQGYVGAVCAFDRGRYNNTISVSGSDSIGYFHNGTVYWGTGTNTTPATYSSTDIIGVAVNMDDGQISFYKNNSLQVTLNFSSTISRLATEGCYANYNNGASSANRSVNLNFGQDSSFAGNKTAQGNTDDNGNGDFYYSPPSGFLALCSANLSDPAIDPAQGEEPADYFNTVLYTGNGASSRKITGVGFDPDFVWHKNRTSAIGHFLIDSVRGAGNNLGTDSSSGDFGGGTNGAMNSVETDGASILAGSSSALNVNTNGYAYVLWNWLAGGSASSNSNGSITSSVSANTEAGFSIVSYTGNQTAGATVGHGLSKAPEVIIAKNRDSATNWMVYHAQNTTAPETEYLGLNLTQATFDTINIWNDTAPTSSVFSIGGGNPVNQSSNEIIAYCFHSVDGYSKFGSYTGNGSSDGPFVYTGFRPALVIVKNSTGTESWGIGDSIRSPINPANDRLYPNLSNAEYSTGDWLDLVSNGFKSRGGAFNTSSATYIYLAFAEQPFKYSNAR